MKLFITSASILTLFVGLSSCEKHVWEDENGNGVVDLYKTHDEAGHDDHGHDDHSDHGHSDKH